MKSDAAVVERDGVVRAELERVVEVLDGEVVLLAVRCALPRL
jgi:hypothetical protein